MPSSETVSEIKSQRVATAPWQGCSSRWATQAARKPGSQESSSSWMAKNSQEDAASPSSKAASRPWEVSLVTTVVRSRSHSGALSRALFTGSVLPASLTMTSSRSWKDCAPTDWTARLSIRGRLRVRVTTVTLGARAACPAIF